MHVFIFVSYLVAFRPDGTSRFRLFGTEPAGGPLSHHLLAFPGQSDLMLAAKPLSAPGLPLGLAENGRQKRRQDGADGFDHEQLDQCKYGTASR